MHKQRRWLIGMVVSTLVVSLLTACGGARQARQPGAVQPASVPSGSGSGSKPEVTIRLGHATSATNPYNFLHPFAVKFADKAREYTGGKVQVDIFPDFQLGSDEEQAKAVRQGSHEATIITTNNLAPLAPAIGFFNLPYMFESDEEVYRAMDGMLDEVNQYVIEDSGIRILSWSYGGMRVLTNSKKPVRSLADLQGLKIRVAQNPIMIGTFKAWGISPVPINWGETFAALQQKVVDGQDNPYSIVMQSKFYEVQKYVTDIDYTGNFAPLLINNKFFTSLKPEYQEALKKAALDAQAFNRQWLRDSTANTRKELEAKGMVLLGRPQDFAAWVEKAKSIWPEYYKTVGRGDAALGQKLVERAMRIKSGR